MNKRQRKKQMKKFVKAFIKIARFEELFALSMKNYKEASRETTD